MHYVYLLRSQINSKKIYIGFTGNVERRLEEHNKAEKGFTSRYQPWELIYFEAYSDKSSATMREVQLKKHANTTQRLKKRLRL